MPQSTSVVDFFFQFDEPTSRLYHINVLSSLLLVLLFAWFVGREPGFLQRIKKWVFRKNYWWNASTRQDYFIYIFNGVFKTVLLVPLLEYSFWISRNTVKGLVGLSGGYDTLDISTGPIAMGLFTLAAFIWDDFLRFAHHWLMHKSPLLWRFHKTHHSARVLTPISLYRSHPVESALAILRNSLSLGVSSGIFVFLFGSTMSVWTLLGVNAFGFLFNFLGANLRHSHIPLSFGIFEKIIISPRQHQIHHSTREEHYDKNFGVTLAIWDLMFGTLVYSKNAGDLRFGLKEPFKKSFAHMLINPFLPGSRTKTDT